MTRLPISKNEPRKKFWLKVDSFAELMKNEEKILEKIKRIPNGGQLFLIHPFMLLQDIGVELSEQAIREIQKQEPRLTGLSDVPYKALKNTKEKQNIRFHLAGLFDPKRRK